jgi:hypothetical protein
MLNQKPLTSFTRMGWASVAAFGLLLGAGCGGGGGNPGARTGGASGGTSGGTTGSTSINMSLVDGAGAAVPNNLLIVGGAYFAKALVKKNNAAVSGKVVVFAAANSSISMTPSSGTVTTDATGTAQVQLFASSITPTVITATVQDGSTQVSASLTVNGATN